MESIGDKSQIFYLKFRRNFHNNYLAYKVLTSPKRIYKLQRVKSRLRVFFIGYSYNIKLI